MLRFSLRQSLALWGITSLILVLAVFFGRFVPADAQVLLGAADGVYLQQLGQRYYFFDEAALPLWSLDGELVALQGENHFYLSDAASRIHYELALQANERFVYRPVWSADSQKIAVLMEEATEGHFRLLIVDCFTKAVSQYEFPAGDTVLLWWETAVELRFVTVAGRQVQLWDYDLASSTLQALQSWRFISYMTRDAVLNPDKNSFILPAITTTLQNFELYAFDIGGDYRNISNRSTHNDTNPIWSPDGSRLAYRALGDSLQFIMLQEANQNERVLARFEDVFIGDMQWLDNETLSSINSYSGQSSFCTIEISPAHSTCSEPSLALFSLSWRPR